MPSLPLILCAYDVSEPTRLTAARVAVSEFSFGGQRSAYECFVTARDLATLAATAALPLALHSDRLGLFRPAPQGSFTLGLGCIAQPSPIVYVG